MRKDKEYVSDPAALKQLKVIRSCFDKADRIIVATDAGREGELIFRYIYQHLGCRKPFDRLWISSLTDKAIREGLSNLKPGDYYDNLYHSAKEEAKLTGSWASTPAVRCPLPAKAAILWDGYRPQHLLWSAVGT